MLKLCACADNLLVADERQVLHDERQITNATQLRKAQARRLCLSDRREVESTCSHQAGPLRDRRHPSYPRYRNAVSADNLQRECCSKDQEDQGVGASASDPESRMEDRGPRLGQVESRVDLQGV